MTSIFQERKSIQMLPIEVTSSLTAVLLVMEYIQELEIECQSPLMGVIRYVKSNHFSFGNNSVGLFQSFYHDKGSFLILYLISDAIRATPSKSLCANISTTRKFIRKNGQEWIKWLGSTESSFGRTDQPEAKMEGYIFS